MRESLLNCIAGGIEEINATRDQKIPLGDLANIRLYGESGLLDSMQLINFLMIVEERMSDQLGIVMSIVSEKAVSQTVSPFNTVSALLEYLLEEVVGVAA